mmetsp:Transcript_25812/g.60062  ORF Transcript_25812/g.60062 Transcript_25812/m.60062 type:complete len:196 (-) Transcript_25812:154-741(-)
MSAFVSLPAAPLPTSLLLSQRPTLRAAPGPRLRTPGLLPSSLACWFTATAATAACALVRRRQRPRAVACSAAVQAKAKARPRPKAKAKAKAKAPVPLMKQASEGIFAPVMLAGQATVGEPFVTKARGKGIGLHAKAITAFCETFSIDNKKRQGFIKTAKTTGHDLGFLIPGGHFGDGLFGKQAMQFWKDLGIDRW